MSDEQPKPQPGDTVRVRVQGQMVTGIVIAVDPDGSLTVRILGTNSPEGVRVIRPRRATT